MFIGEYTHNIDPKKRLAVPIKFRKLLGEQVVITRGLDQCLTIYPIKEWEILADKLSKLPINQSEARGFVRLMLGGAMQVDIDSLGRILVPDYLKDYAHLTKKVVLAGLYNRIEIWDEERWSDYRKNTESEAENIAAKLETI